MAAGAGPDKGAGLRRGGRVAYRGRGVGWVAERLKAAVLKTANRGTGSWVRIPPHPPKLLCNPLMQNTI